MVKNKTGMSIPEIPVAGKRYVRTTGADSGLHAGTNGCMSREALFGVDAGGRMRHPDSTENPLPSLRKPG